VIEGTFVATYLPEVSVDGISWVDATSFFFNLSTGVVIPGGGITTDLQMYTKQNLPNLRFRCTAFTSAGAPGTDAAPHVMIMGQDSRSE